MGVLSLYYRSYKSGDNMLMLSLTQKQHRSETKIFLRTLEVEEGETKMEPIQLNYPSISEYRNLLQNSTKIQGRELKTILENNSRSASLELVLANNRQQKQF